MFQSGTSSTFKDLGIPQTLGYAKGNCDGSVAQDKFCLLQNDERSCIDQTPFAFLAVEKASDLGGSSGLVGLRPGGAGAHLPGTLQ
jgi:hypothetical protein